MYTVFSTKVRPFFLSLLSVRLQGLADCSQMVELLFSNIMHLFYYDPRNKSYCWKYSATKDRKQLVSQFGKLSESHTLASAPHAAVLV